MLANCYRSSLTLATQHQCRTIAFPSISTGIYGFPIERAARIAVSEVGAFLELDRSLQHVIFVTFSPADYATYERVMNESIEK